MDADDFQSLYKLLRGSRSAPVVLDARALYLEKKMTEALERLTYARDTFVESRSRLIKQDVAKSVDAKAKDADRQIKKLKRKQDKVLEIVKGFDELVPALEKLAAREQARKEKEAASRPRGESPAQEEEPATQPQRKPEAIVARIGDVSQSFVESYQRATGDQLLDVIGGEFSFREVRTEQDILGDALYYIQTSKKSLLVCTPSAEEMSDQIELMGAIDAKPIKPLTRKAFLKLGIGRKMVLLTLREDQLDTIEIKGIEMDTDDTDLPADLDANDLGANDGGKRAPNVLDSGAFSQLLSAAQRSGLVPGADQIGHVRDREFRMGKYEHAFQAIDSMFSRFNAGASQRLQQLAREDAEIAAGRIKISPKDLQAKRARDRMQTQEIDRAKRRFQVVLEGLRVLMNQ